jgi:adenylosuccinate synthase
MDLEDLEQCTPVYQSFPGWDEDISRVRLTADLPAAARQFLSAIEDAVGVKVELISIGPDRSQTIIGPNSPLDAWISSQS